MKLRLELDDGRVFEAEANEKTMFGLADRIAFEKKFRISATVMGSWMELFDDTGTPRPDADTSGIREEYLAFMFWRELRRRSNGTPVPDWDEVIEHVIDITADLTADPEADAVDPTSPSSTPTAT